MRARCAASWRSWRGSIARIKKIRGAARRRLNAMGREEGEWNGRSLISIDSISSKIMNNRRRGGWRVLMYRCSCSHGFFRRAHIWAIIVFSRGITLTIPCGSCWLSMSGIVAWHSSWKQCVGGVAPSVWRVSNQRRWRRDFVKLAEGTCRGWWASRWTGNKRRRGERRGGGGGGAVWAKAALLVTWQIAHALFLLLLLSGSIGKTTPPAHHSISKNARSIVSPTKHMRKKRYAAK